jgi:hypothetical protein
MPVTQKVYRALLLLFLLLFFPFFHPGILLSFQRSHTITAAAKTTSATYTSPLSFSSSSSSSSNSTMKITPETDIFRAVEFVIPSQKTNQENAAFRDTLNRLFHKFRPSLHPFFANLKALPKDISTNRGFLNELYLRYQTAMHATRGKITFRLINYHLINLIEKKRKIYFALQLQFTEFRTSTALL